MIYLISYINFKYIYGRLESLRSILPDKFLESQQWPASIESRLLSSPVSSASEEGFSQDSVAIELGPGQQCLCCTWAWACSFRMDVVQWAAELQLAPESMPELRDLPAG